MKLGRLIARLFRDSREEELREPDYAALWAAVPEATRAKAVEVLREHVPVKVWIQVREAIAADPEGWVHPYHFGWGMAIRNLLRKHVCSDPELPSGNWDDYYVQAVEEASR